MSIRLGRHLAVSLGLLGILAAAADAQTNLRYKFQKGQTNAFEMVQQMKIGQTIMGNNIESAMKQTVDLAMTVEDVNSDGSAQVKTKFSRVRMEMNAPPPLGNLVLDSTDANLPDNPVAKLMGGMIKTLGKIEFTATMSPRGEMLDFKIPEDLVKEFRAMPGAAQMGEMFSEKGLKSMMGQSGLVLPKDAVKKGDTWTQKVATKLPFGKMDVEMKYTYEGPETVDGKTLEKITYIPQSTVDPDANAAITLKLESQKGNGTIHFDNDAGRMQSMVLNQLMEMSVGVANMNLSQKIDQTMTMKLKKQ